MRPVIQTPAVLLLSGATITCRMPREVYDRIITDDANRWPDAVSYRNRTPNHVNQREL